MDKIKVFVTFYETIPTGNWYGKVVRFVQRNLSDEFYEHCSIVVVLDNSKSVVYHVSATHYSRWVNEKACHKIWSPSACIYLGEHEVNLDELYNIKPIIFSPLRTLLYYLITRKLPLKWKPKNTCSIKLCEILRTIGIDIKDRVLPINIYKELIKDANDINCWKG